MPKKSNVRKHFTPVKDDRGNTIVGKAKCNHCPGNSKEFDTTAGTTNRWRHFLKHFTRTIPDDQGNEKGIVQCNVCQAKLKASSAKSTSSLVQHVEACNRMGAAAAVRASRPPAVQTGAPSGFGSSSMDLEPADYLCAQPLPQLLPSAPSHPGESSSSGGAVPDMDEPSKRLAQMIALHGFDPSIVENDGFKSFVESLNPEYRIPKRVKIEDACDHIFKQAEADIEDLLYGGDSDRFSLAVGKAKIMEREVVYIAYHFIDDEWNLQKVIKNVYLDRPSPYHLGYLDNLISHICVKSHLEEAMRNFFCFIGSSFKLVVFMMAWGITKDHSMLKDCINQNFPGTSVIAKGLVCTTFMDVVFQSVAEHLYLQIDAKFREDMHSTELLLTRQQREEILSHVGVDPWAYNEAWYSWYCSLEVLRNEEQEADSELTRILCNIWGVIYRAIKTISAPKPPTSHLCLLELLHVKKVLEELALASGDSTINHRGCSTGFIESKYVTTVLTELISILDTAIQESYLVWSIPFVLDPRYNRAGVEEAFRGAFGEAADSYISESRKHVKVVYSKYLEAGCDEERCQAELDLYFSNFYVVVRRTEDFDILNWWKIHGSHHYPTVARMAKDALAMPTSSQLTSEQIAHVKSRLRGYSLGDDY